MTLYFSPRSTDHSCRRQRNLSALSIEPVSILNPWQIPARASSILSIPYWRESLFISITPSRTQ